MESQKDHKILVWIWIVLIICKCFGWFGGLPWWLLCLPFIIWGFALFLLVLVVVVDRMFK